MSRDLSLMPSGRKGTSANLPSNPTLRIILICSALIILALVASWQTSGQLATQKTLLSETESQQQQLKLRSQSMKEQLDALQTAGGASRVDLVKGLAKARVDWKEIILAVARESSPGIIISTFSATAPLAPGEGSAETNLQSSDMQLAGSAASRDQLQAFIKRLRSKNKVFLEAELRKASSQIVPTDPTSPNKAPKSEKVDWDMALTLAPVAPLPTNGTGVTP